jgi:hypothetical protein
MTSFKKNPGIALYIISARETQRENIWSVSYHRLIHIHGKCLQPGGPRNDMDTRAGSTCSKWKVLAALK